ncbi:MAG: hypothetical protein JNJ48_04580 [Phycisphaerae bacterium]|nr:hypothetical protein [Phycisphaerae bacterium]
MRRPSHRSRGAFTIIEAALASVVVATMLAAALGAAGSAATSRARALWRVQGQNLAAALLSEATAKAYSDPDLVSVGLGPDLGESHADRSTLDDTDDFNGYVQSPPRSAAGTRLVAESGWSWSCSVAWVSPSNPGGSAALLDTGLKRITVVVTRNKVEVGRLVGLVSSAK